MVKYSKDVDVCNIDLYMDRIGRMGHLCFDREMLQKSNNHYEAIALTNKDLAVTKMSITSGMSQLNLSKDGIFKYLTQYEGCPEHYFFTKKTSGVSLDNKKVLSKVYQNGYGREFLDYYAGYKSWSMKCSKVDSILKGCYTKCGVNKFGQELYELPYEVNPQQNLRFNYKNYDVISQIHKDVVSCLSIPEGYCLAWGDFAQSDFRIAYNLFLRSPENDKIMCMYDDKYEALARIVAKTLGEPFNYAQFKEERAIYKVLTLATIYGTRNSLVPAEAKFIQTFTEFLMKCPKYVEYLDRINVRIDLGLPISVTSYFGYEQSIPIVNGVNTLDKALNTPIQTGTSEIIILTVNKILDAFYARGWTEDDIGVYLVRHDEPIFWMKEEVMKDSWILQQFNQIIVDEWTPLQLDFKFGYSYKVSDEALTEKFTKSVNENLDKIDLVIADNSAENTYFPMAPSFQLFVTWKPVEDKSIVAMYSDKLNQVAFMCVDSTDKEQVSLAIRARFRNCADRIYDAGYRGVSVITTEFDGEDRFGRQYFKYKLEQTARLNKVSILCRYMICRYCSKNRIPCPVDPPYESDGIWIKEVEEMELLRG